MAVDAQPPASGGGGQVPGGQLADLPPGFDRDRMMEVLKIKEQANEKFRSGDFFSAKCLYSGSLEMLERCCLHLDRADDVWEGIKNNMALCDLKRQEWARAVETTSEILQRNSKNTKALYRRGVARIGQSKLKEAREDLEAVVELDPENADARHKLAEILKQLRANRTAEKEQADKLRGFLRGERIDDTVPITEDGSVRKLHGNENAPLFATWIKRSWLQEKSGVAGVITAHVVMKTTSGKELLNTRKPPGALSTELGANAAAPKAAERPAEPARWVLDDAYGAVFGAWNSAGKTLQLYELGKFEVARRQMGPSVEGTIRKCLQQWLPESAAQREMYKDVSDEVKQAALRRQAIQILGLPEEFSLEEEKDSESTLTMEMELLESAEYVDVDGDGRYLVQTIREGKPGGALVREMSTVQAHFRIAKLLMNYALKDTRMGLANGPDGLVLRADRTKEPVEFTLGEELCSSEGDFVPPCVGQCLKLYPGPVTEGTHFEVILRDGVPIREMERDIHSAFSDGRYAGLPDTSGPVCIRIEVEKVAPACEGPADVQWKALETLVSERRSAEALEGRHQDASALRRWRRILRWFDDIFASRSWRTNADTAGDSMYDLHWDEAAPSTSSTASPWQFTAAAAEAETLQRRTETVEKMPERMELEDALLQQLSPDELREFAAAHAACAALTTAQVSAQHGRCVVQASRLTTVPVDVEVKGRSALAWRLSEEGKSQEALAILKEAQALDPQNTALRDQAAKLNQQVPRTAAAARAGGLDPQDSQSKSVTTLEALKSLKHDLNDSLEAKDVVGLKALLEELDALPLTWEAASETKIGKEVGCCAKLSDPAVSELAKQIIARLHKLAKQERPLWVR